MSYHVIQPPKEEAALAQVGKELVELTRAFGMTVDPEGFLYAWISGTRVVTERDDAGKIVTLAMIQIGKRWITNDLTGTVLLLEGNREPMIEFLKSICAAMGASEMFVQDPVPKQKVKYREYTVIGYELG